MSTLQPIGIDEETCIEKQLDNDYLILQKRKARWNADRAVLGPLTKALQELGIEPKIEYDYDIHFTGNKELLGKVMGLLRTSGYNTGESRPKEKEPTWAAWYRKPDMEFSIWVSFTSSVCKRVKIGSEMVEQDIYEVRCE